MLRVMKRKLQQEENVPEGGTCLTLETRIGEELSESRIVSHVPVGSRTPVSCISSDNSCLSTLSAQCNHHPSRKSNDETGNHESPVLKPTVPVGEEGFVRSESQSTNQITEASVSIASVAVPQQHGFTRTVSSVSVDMVEESHKTKRASLETAACIQEAKPIQGQARVLLATAKDTSVLSPLHIFVRQQIEVFEASDDDLKQPAPGRRVPIKPNQVGLRCMHCKQQNAKERKKRAVCYPSSVARIYHSVSDMKFAHFPCPHMPQDLQQKFSELKDESQVQGKVSKDVPKHVGNVSGSTAQYYHDSACELGMMDGKGGIFASKGFSCDPVVGQRGAPLGQSPQLDPSLALVAFSQANALQGMLLGNLLPYARASVIAAQNEANATRPLETAKLMPTFAVVRSAYQSNDAKLIQKPPSQPQPDGRQILLSSKMDEHYLAPIHCFVRRHVEVFAANEQDLAAPAPGRKKPIVLGQVGLRCVHCARLPVKERVKRAICFPPATSGIYHALSNMKFDHFKHCKGLPNQARDEFEELSSSPSSASNTGKRSASRPRVSNSTAQYYHDSALRMGLYDTDNGIRFQQQPSNASPPAKTIEAEGHHFPAGMEALIIAATDPNIRAAHEERKASPVAGLSV